MASWQWFGNAHRAIYRMTKGRIGASLAGRPMLLLTTTGRKSGEPRTTPLSYLRDGDDCVIVASNNGGDLHPAWWLNIAVNSEAKIEVGSEAWAVEAKRAEGDAYERLWPMLLAYNPQYKGYQAKTKREIPVVVLRRV